MAIHLRDSTESLTFTLGGSNAHEYHISYEQFGEGGSGPTLKVASGAVSDTNQTAVVTPTVGPVRIKSIHIRNTTGNSTTVHVESKISSTSRSLLSVITLASGESVGYESGSGWQVYLTTGNKKAAA